MPDKHFLTSVTSPISLFCSYPALAHIAWGHVEFTGVSSDMPSKHMTTIVTIVSSILPSYMCSASIAPVFPIAKEMILSYRPVHVSS